MFRKGITSLSGLEMGAVKPHLGFEYTVFLGGGMGPFQNDFVIFIHLC